MTHAIIRRMTPVDILDLQFYTRPDCELCDAALVVVKRVAKKVPSTISIININSTSALVEKYGEVIPVLTCNNLELARSFVDEKALLRALQTLSKDHSSASF